MTLPTPLPPKSPKWNPTSPRGRPVFHETVPSVSANIVLALLDAEDELFFSGRNVTPRAILVSGYRRARCTRMELLAAAARLNAWRGGESVMDPLRETGVSSAILARERMFRSQLARQRAATIITEFPLRVIDAQRLSQSGVLMVEGMNGVDMEKMRSAVAAVTSDA